MFLICNTCVLLLVIVLDTHADLGAAQSGTSRLHFVAPPAHSVLHKVHKYHISAFLPNQASYHIVVVIREGIAPASAKNSCLI